MTTPIGCVHGRFQPFHNGHLEYVRGAKKLCDFLWIGLTQYDIKNLQQSQEAAHRQAYSNNPFTYWQRVEMIQAALVKCGIPRAEFGFCPFPIEKPDLLSDFIGRNAVQYTTIVEDWNREKVLRLKREGFDVHVLWERSEKSPTGEAIRAKMQAGDQSWIEQVPPAVAKYIEKIAPRVFP